MTNFLLVVLILVTILNGMNRRAWQRRICGRLNRLPHRIASQSGAVTYYAPDDPGDFALHR